jgi:hypothetical protein
MDEISENYSALEAVQNIAEFANAVASLVVGHRKILVEGDFDVNLADSMAAALHASLLGLVPVWEQEHDDATFYAYEDIAEDEEDE